MRIRRVTPIHLAEPVPVYDLTVPQTENFALASGPFVHNSKDCSDALAGALWTLSQVQFNMPVMPVRHSAYGGGGDDWLPSRPIIGSESDYRSLPEHADEYARYLPVERFEPIPFVGGGGGMYGGGSDPWGGNGGGGWGR